MALLAKGRRRAGLGFGILVIVADVAVNAYAWRALGIEAFATAIPVQAAFLGFLLGAAELVWPKRPLASRA